MEMHQLEYVLAVAKYNGFTRAAEEINASQSSLSQQISKLENELGINLFMRTTRSLEITPAGQKFLVHAGRIMSEVIEARRCIHEYISFEKGNLTLGIIPIIGHYHLPQLLSSFKKSFPRITLSLREKQCSELLDLLNSSEIDAAFVQIVVDDPNLKFRPLVDDQMVIVTSDRHPLATRKSVALNELKGENFIVPPATSGHNHHFQKACQAENFNPRIVLTCSSVKTILGLVREGIGIAVLPSGVVSMNWGFGTTNLRLTPAINENIYLATKNNDLPPAVRMFTKLASQWLKN